MAVVDAVATVEARLWTLLLASADFLDLTADKVGNRIRQDVPAKQRSPDAKGAKQRADFPEVKLERTRWRRTPFRETVTFGNCAPIEVGEQTFTLTITMDDQGEVKAGEIEQAAADAIVAGGAQLGLASTVRLLEEITAESGVADVKGVRRRQSVLTIRISMRIN